MKLEDMVVRDGRKLPEVWLDAGNEVRESDFIAFVSIPEGKTGKVFIEYGNGATHMIALHTFHPNANTDFEAGVGVTAGEAVTSGKIWVESARAAAP